LGCWVVISIGRYALGVVRILGFVWERSILLVVTFLRIVQFCATHSCRIVVWDPAHLETTIATHESIKLSAGSRQLVDLGTSQLNSSVYEMAF